MVSRRILCPPLQQHPSDVNLTPDACKETKCNLPSCCCWFQCLQDEEAPHLIVRSSLRGRREAAGADNQSVLPSRRSAPSEAPQQGAHRRSGLTSERRRSTSDHRAAAALRGERVRPLRTDGGAADCCNTAIWWPHRGTARGKNLIRLLIYLASMCLCRFVFAFKNKFKKIY